MFQTKVVGHRGRVAFVLAWAILLLYGFGQVQSGATIHVPGDYPTIAQALAEAPPHAVVKIAPGDYRESLVIERPVILRGEPAGGATVWAMADAAGIEIVGTHDVLIAGLNIVGGKYGIFVTHSQDVTVENNIVSRSRLVGIRVRLAAANILNNLVEQTDQPYGQGIHITNTTQWPASRVVGNTVLGHAKSGIITNMALGVRIEGNTVTGNHQHGIAITEMSHAVVVANQVDRNEANGIYIDDMSVAQVCNNVVTNTVSAEQRGLHYGNGILVDFHSRAELINNTISGNENYGIQALFHSQVVARANDVRGNGVGIADDIYILEDPVGPGCGGVETEP